MIGFKLIETVPLSYFKKWYFKPECAVIGGTAAIQLGLGVYSMIHSFMKPDVDFMHKGEDMSELQKVLFPPSKDA